jgi:hypothetical protein
MYSVVVVFPETGRHDGSSVSDEMARKFRSENFWKLFVGLKMYS